MTDYMNSPKKKNETLVDDSSFQESFRSISDLGSDAGDFEDESVVVVESDEEVEESDSDNGDDSIVAEVPDAVEDELSTKTPRSVPTKGEQVNETPTPSPKNPNGRTHHLRIPPGRNTSFSDESFPKPRQEQRDSPPRRGVTRNVSFDGHEGRVVLSTLDKRTKPKSYKSSGSLEFMRMSATRNPRESLVRKLSVEDLFGPQSEIMYSNHTKVSGTS